MQISVIIPSGRPDRVERTLAGLLGQEAGYRFDIYLVTPFPDALHKLVTPRVHIVETDRLYPPGKMRNIGAQAAGGDILAFIDDDCLPPSTWLAVMVEHLLSFTDTAAVGCRVVSGESGFWPQCADYCLFVDYQGMGDSIGPIGSAAIVVRRDAWAEVGGFDEQLRASEDWELCLKLQERGWVTRHLAAAVVHHFHGRGSFTAIMKNSFLSGYRSGLTVQLRRRDQLSWLARLSLSFRSPWLYPLLILPYASAVTLLQARTLWRPALVFHLPMLFASRLVYHFGVWYRLGSTRKGEE